MNEITKIVITIALPGRDLSPNGRAHYMKRHAARKVQRVAAWALAVEALNGNPPPYWERVKLNIYWYHPTKSWPDVDNAIGSLKGFFDGLQDAGIIENDKGVELGEVVRSKFAENPRVEIEITPLPERPTP